LFVLFVLCALAVVGGGCDLFGAADDGDDGGTALPEGPAVAASMDGGEDSALWVFDAGTLERTAVIETEDGFPDGVAFSPNYERWYVSWDIGIDEDARNVREILDPTTGNITKRVTTSDLSVGDGPLFYEPITDHVVANGSDVEYFDPETLELTGRPFEDGGRVAVAEERGELYFVSDRNEISVYDAAERELLRTIRLPRARWLMDIGLSPNEDHLFATSWPRDFERPGRFHVVDLETGETVFEGGPVGKSANLAVCPDGRYVYIDAPGGGPLAQAPSTGKVYRFDVEARELEVFLDWRGGGPSEVTGGHGLAADYITMLPDGDAFVILNRAAYVDYRPEAEGEPAPPLLKIDAETGEVLATYTLPRDDGGYIRATVRQLHFGVVPE
jgi:DNA-binding beta-propeller fold protein YncE